MSEHEEKGLLSQDSGEASNYYCDQETCALIIIVEQGQNHIQETGRLDQVQYGKRIIEETNSYCIILHFQGLFKAVRILTCVVPTQP